MGPAKSWKWGVGRPPPHLLLVHPPLALEPADRQPQDAWSRQIGVPAGADAN